MNIPLLVLLVLLTAVPKALANVINDVNIKSSGGSSKTNVEIHQTGEGTSKVNINGKEWKLEGPGNISVSEESSPKPTSTATPSATPLASPQNTAEEAQKNVITQIIKALQQLIERLKNLF